MLCAMNGATTMPYTLQEDIEAASKAGISGLEIWWDKVEAFLESRTSEDLAELLQEYNVKPAGICPFPVSPFRNTEKNRETFRKALQVAKAIECGLMTVCPDFCPINMDTETAVKKLGEEFRYYSELAADCNVRLAIEPISRHTIAHGPATVLRIIHAAGDPDNLGLLIDTFHYSCSGIASEETRSIPKDKLYIVHVNDSSYGTRDELTDADRLYPLEGYLDLKSFMDDICTIGYDGYLSVEIFNRQYWKSPIDDICQKVMESYDRLVRL